MIVLRRGKYQLVPIDAYASHPPFSLNISHIELLNSLCTTYFFRGNIKPNQPWVMKRKQEDILFIIPVTIESSCLCHLVRQLNFSDLLVFNHQKIPGIAGEHVNLIFDFQCPYVIPSCGITCFKIHVKLIMVIVFFGKPKLIVP